MLAGRKADRVAVGRWSHLSRLLTLSTMLGLCGCLGNSPRAVDDDPIFGGSGSIPLNAPTTPGARGSAAGGGTAESGAPLLPPARTPSAPAALASGAVGVGLTPQQPASDAAVTLGGPRSADSTSRLVPTPAPGTVLPVAATSVPVAAEGSYEQLQEMLLARGVSWQQLKTGSGKDEWVFSCAVPLRNNMEQRYDGRAVGRGGLAAIRAVIEQIDKERTGQ
jgi:hypothetical protein